MTEIEIFNKERDEALLTLNEKTIKDFMNKWKVPYSCYDEIFWRSVHKAITGIISFPIEFRKSSKDWLKERKSTSFDDGELLEENGGEE